MKNIFLIIENPYNLRNETKFKSRNIHTVRHGIEAASFVAPIIWSSIPRNYKECSSVKEFKAKIKFWCIHANFANITSIKYVTHKTGYLLFVHVSVICESLFRYHKAELSYCIFPIFVYTFESRQL